MSAAGMELPLTRQPSTLVAPHARNDDEYSMTTWGHILHACGLAIACALPWYGAVTVSTGDEGIQLEFGRVRAVLQPGIHAMNPCSQSIVRISMRRITLDVKRQMVLTADKLEVSIDSDVVVRIVDSVTAGLLTTQVYESAKCQTMGVLRAKFGEHDLDYCLTHREELSSSVCAQVNAAMQSMGLLVERVVITDISLPRELQAAMARRATTETEAASKIRLAEADAQAARIMNDAASALSDPNAMAVRTLKTLETVAATGKATLLVVPPNMGDFARTLAAGSVASEGVHELVQRQPTEESKH